MKNINIPNKKLSKDMLKDDAAIILETFPHDKARPYQLESLCIAFRALFIDDFENVVCQIPTGVGKSGIAIALGEYAKRKLFEPYFILTSNLGLTKQYKAHFSFLAEVKGRRNFQCIANHQICSACGRHCSDQNCTADKAPCAKSYKKYNCKFKDQCPYIIQRNNAIESFSTLTNPQYLFRAANPNTPDFFPKRHLAIYDEAHNLEGVLMGYIERRLTQGDYTFAFTGATLPAYTNPQSWTKVARSMLDKVGPQLDKYKELMDKNDWVLSKIDMRTIDRLETLVDKLNDILHILTDADNVVLLFNKDKHEQPFVIFKPCKVSYFAPTFLKRVSKKRLFLSATIPPSTFIDSMGLDPSKTLFINVTKSPFPKANRPIYADPVGHISKLVRFDDADIKYKFKDKINDILNEHRNDKVVIIPNSHKLRKLIYDLLLDSTHAKRALTHTDFDREATISKFLDGKEPSVIVSTYMREGFDLYDDRCRALIIPKIPYPDLTNALVKTRMKNDELLYRKRVGDLGCDYMSPKREGGLCSNFRCEQPCQEWYKAQTMVSLVQACGRAVRHAKDYADTYILDSAWGRFRYVAEDLIPQFFLESVVDR